MTTGYGWHREAGECEKVRETAKERSRYADGEDKHLQRRESEARGHERAEENEHKGYGALGVAARGRDGDQRSDVNTKKICRFTGWNSSVQSSHIVTRNTLLYYCTCPVSTRKDPRPRSSISI
ncbi:hypothetical protein MPTK1_6g00520 [Marchantia polymorpha subsp. ruderalis]|uniref:Uncharacterized protein n=2 Tax=Marchantia polymorpha TaxID=3197 RepID=A0AAF6BM33_MARPO|nr:hypothetical protein MARPO_0104s0014 [Marchantia polymorpha]BBN13067.1 hypothetical protein Mp_6g00520 [Marchantia polymorpha subsp. ruderalis]|eukprot:PTQ31978.1 hypothetical protein MARPO_0104s0014 [Marchantia polymorpha]